MVIGIRNNGICGILGQCVVAASFLAVALQVMDPALAALGAVGLLNTSTVIVKFDHNRVYEHIGTTYEIRRKSRSCIKRNSPV